MEKHSAPISDAAFSPDGTALATASLDGYVKFFQVNMSSSGESSPRCLHQWKPHDGKPLSCLFFLDNHKNPLPDVQFWKYAVTGACNNTEIKTWSCEDWLCNQEISFQTPPDSKLETSNLCMKAAIDPSSRYLILSDIYRRVLYVLIISQESAPFVESISNGDANESSLSHNSVKAGVARIVSISELPVQYPAMFLTITDAEWKPYKRWKHEHPAVSCLEDKDDDEDVDDDDRDNIVEGLVVKCIFMNTKSLQDVSIRFQPVFPPSSYNATGVTSSNHRLSISDDSVVLKDGLTDLSINLSATLNELDTSKGKNLSENDGTSLDNLVAFTSSPSCSNVVSEDIVRSLSSSTCVPVGVISSLPCALSDSTPIPSLSSPTVTNSVECVSSNQPVTMNLLTPESFSSPGRANEDQHHEKCDSMKPIEPVRDIFTKTSSPSEDLKSAALSLMLKVNSASLMPSSDVVSSVASLASISSQNIESSSVLDTVVAGSSKSPPVVSLPPPPRKGTSPLPDSEDAPLATSEVSRLTPSKKNEIDLTSSNDYVNGTSGAVVTSTTISHMSSGIALASSTSSPSLEVQQILHSHNSRNEEDFAENENEGEDIHPSSVKATQDSNGTLQASSLQELIDITAGSKVDAPPIPQSPLLDVFASLKSFPSCTSSLTDSGIQQSSSHRDKSLMNITKLAEGIPPSQPFGVKDSAESLQLFKNISIGKNHLTCEELEAEIKCSSPTSGRVQQQVSDAPSSSSNSLSSSMFPMNLVEIGGGNSVTTSLLAMPNSSADSQAKSFERVLSEISSLRECVLAFQKEQDDKTQALLSISGTIASQVDRNSKTLLQINKTLEDIRKSQNRLQETIPQVITSSSKSIIENCIRQEIRNAITPAINKCLDPIRNHLNSEIRCMVSNSEAHLTDALNKTTCSRNFIDNMSSSIASALSASVQSSCRDAYNKVVVPGFNAITQQVFTQLNEAFMKGTKEYMQHFENEIQSTRTTLIENLGTTSKTIESTSTSLSSHVTVLMETLHKSIAQQATLSDTLGERMRHFIHDEIMRALQEHHASVEARTSRAQTPASSGTHTPSNPKIARQQVQQLLAQEQFNLAFKQALSASDLSLVVFVCERINPQQLFSSQTPCPLSQDVLLSLVNQLSHDLTTFTDLKTKYNVRLDITSTVMNIFKILNLHWLRLSEMYLEEAVMNLDTAHPVTREHMRQVLQDLQRSLSSYLEHNPGHKKLRMLLLAVNHLVAA
ncbi:Enhancer of mRNA-decapping protein 4 [Armadillidium nasatum]|uniref:Enhancer of mRNA-decapping protein 4 n=1 Tax=Armadillidium nasatum TaxID=96803 RepID=A0A5N5T4Z5_9CRUS|nr:Enhancer of mRNA-decapping protein 4 [Armadillidium nasatum]